GDGDGSGPKGQPETSRGVSGASNASRREPPDRTGHGFAPRRARKDGPRAPPARVPLAPVFRGLRRLAALVAFAPRLVSGWPFGPLPSPSPHLWRSTSFRRASGALI